MKGLRKQKGITLIALVVTIVVLLILAGITITMLFSDNGIIRKATESRDEQELARVKEIIGIEYLGGVLDKIVQGGGTATEDAIAGVLTEAFVKLSNKGYEVKTVSNSGQTLKGIKMQDTTGKNVSTVSLEQGKSTTVKISLDIEGGSTKHYVKIKNSWHEVKIENGKINVAENGESEVDGKTYTIKLTPPSTGATMKVGETQITVETTVASGADIEIIAGNEAGDHNFRITVEGTEHVVNGKVTVKSISWTNKGKGIFECGGKTVKIGDYVTYDPGSYTHTPDVSKGSGTGTSSGGNYTPYTLTTSQLVTQANFNSWRVLGVNSKGQLELISSNPTTQILYLANDTGYLNAETTYNEDGSIKQLSTIDAFCNDLYGKGSITKDGKTEKIAESARSLNVEDIDKISRFYKRGYSDTFGTYYGEKWQYQFPSGGSYMQYRKKGTASDATWSDWSDITGEYDQKLMMPGSSKIIDINNPGEGPELENTFYTYSIAKNITTSDGYTSELATTISNMVTKGTENSNISQWLASTSVGCGSTQVNFGVRSIYNGDVRYGYLFRSDGEYRSSNHRVRPVVTIASGVRLTGTGENLGTASNPYTLSK